MPEPAASPSPLAHFGAGGMRRITVPPVVAGLPHSAREHLGSVGVPLHVSPYFKAADENDGLTLGVFTGYRRVVLQDERSKWLRIGTDRLAQLCVLPDGTVRAVFLARPEPDLFVSSDVAAFTESLTALDRHLPVIATATGFAAAAAGFQELHAEVLGIDPAAVEDRDSWWSRVLDDVRHTLNFPFSAAVEYVDRAGDKQIVTQATGPGRPHPEELLWARLSADGVVPEQVRRVYCELEPCMLPGHYCAAWLQATLPHAEFTHSFDYGDTAESRETGLRELMVHASRQRAEDR